MLDRKVKSIRALDRGLEVLQILQRSEGISLHGLHEATGLPKATLTRILVTLAGRKLVWQRIADGAYMPSHTLRHSAGFERADQILVEVSSQILDDLGQRLAWPSVLSVPRADYMEVIETNTPRAYFDHVPLGPIGYRINMIQSATGRAYLAFCGEARRAELFRLLGLDDPAMPHRVLLDHTLAEARRRGYASREPKILDLPVKTYQAPPDDRHSIAVPVLIGDEPVACLNVTWAARTAGIASFTKRHLDDLRAAAAEIGKRFAASKALASSAGAL